MLWRQDLLNVGLAFAEGFSLIITPCILPILPIILSGTLAGGKKRPFGIILGFILAFSLFTFFSRALLKLSGIDPNTIRDLSFGLLILLGFIMMSDTLTAKFDILASRYIKAGNLVDKPTQNQDSFTSGLLFGALIGLVWTPCAGPILAVVIVQSLLQESNLWGFFIVFAFATGAAVPMGLIALFGRAFLQKMQFFRKNSTLLRKGLGLIIILSTLFLMFGTQLIVQGQSHATSFNATGKRNLINPLPQPYPAPDFQQIEQWINTPPLTMASLKGKVVLIDFWAYSCINCIRTLPYLKSWDQHYRDAGFVIVGVHSPEFDFERDFQNLKHAVEQDQIHYPVAMDNQFGTWRSYNNAYWPAHYLIDRAGNVVYEHFGEGEYDVTENNIQVLLGMQKPITPPTATSPGFDLRQTPETYLGYDRQEQYHGSEPILKDHPQTYHFPESLSRNAWGLAGSWNISAQKITALEKDAGIRLHFHAGNVYAVMGLVGNQPVSVQVSLDGKPVSSVEVKGHNLYTLLDNKKGMDGIIELHANAPGLEVYTFTFGG